MEEPTIADDALKRAKAAKLTRQARERRLLADTADLEAAVPLLRQAVEIAPAYAPAYAELAEVYAAWSQRRSITGQEHQSLDDMAFACAERSLALEPWLAVSHRAMAVALRRGRRRVDAERRIQEAEEAASLAPEDPECLLEKWRVDGYDPDDGTLARVLALKPGLIAAHVDLGSVLCGLERYAEALAELEKAVELNPQNAQAYYEIARVLDKMGMRPKAVELLRKALAAQPEEPLLRQALAQLEGS